MLKILSTVIISLSDCFFLGTKLPVPIVIAQEGIPVYQIALKVEKIGKSITNSLHITNPQFYGEFYYWSTLPKV